MFHSHQLGSGKIGDYCDGELFKNHQLYTSNPCALQIILYFDELETCNVLGSKAKIHKLSKCHIVLAIIVPIAIGVNIGVIILSIIYYYIIIDSGFHEQ